ASVHFFSHEPATSELSTLSLRDALPIYRRLSAVRIARGNGLGNGVMLLVALCKAIGTGRHAALHAHARIGSDLAQQRIQIGRERSEEHTSELQSRGHLVCRLLLEKKN